MKTKYESVDNCITVSVLSDGGHILYAIGHIFLEGEGSMKYIKSFQLFNIDLTPPKFSVFCRSLVNCSLPILEKRVSSCSAGDDLELDFELR